MNLANASATTSTASPPRPPTLELPAMSTSLATHKIPPLICEQGPSAPASPTSPATRQRRLCPPLTLEAMHRINLLTAGYSHDFGKLSPVSPNYPTSDLGSSPRSSISMPSGLGPWTAYREQNKSSFDLDEKDLNSPGFLLSPAPYSPFSDGDETPLSLFARSPNLSPNISSAFHHFSFDPIRSSSSMSNKHHLLVPSTSLDEQSRERSRSDSDMSPSEERVEPHSTISVPVASTAYKKRLLQKYQQEERKRPRSSSSPPPSTTGSEDDLRSVSRASPPPPPLAYGVQPSLHAALPSTTAVSGWIESQMSLINNVLLQMPRPQPQLLIPPPADGSHSARILQRQAAIDDGGGPLKGTTLWRRSRSETDVSRQQPIANNYANGVFTCATCGAGFSCHDRLAKHIASRHRDRSATAALDEGAKIHKCTQCPKKFTRSDMLTRHMRLHTGAKPYECTVCGQVFSRSDHLSTHHRTHTGEKPYQCSKCSYTASRRDMITRHFRTHDVREGDVSLCRLSLSSPSPVPPGLPGGPPTGFPLPLLSPSSPLPLPMALLSLNPPDPSTLNTTPSIGSGERSAFAPPPQRLLVPPPLMHSLSVPSSPLLSRQNSLSPGCLSRQSSVGGYDAPVGGL